MGAASSLSGLVFLLLLLGITLLGRSVRAPGPALVVAVTLLPYLYAALAAWTFTVWCVVPDRRLPPIVLGLLLAAAAVVWGPSFPARPQTAEGPALRVMSWNVQRLWADVDDARGCVLDELRRVDPDVLTLLEISKKGVADLEQELGLDCVHADYFGTGSEQRGGLAVCVDDARLGVSGGGQRFVDGDDWRYVSAEVTGAGRPFNVLAVHLQPYWPLTGARMRDSVSELAHGEAQPLLAVSREGTAVVERQGAQSAALLDRMARFSDPTLVAGDFNSTRDSSLHTALRQRLVDTFAQGGQGAGNTVRALGWLPLRVDYVYGTRDFAVRASEVGTDACSDHRPVISSLILRDER